MKDKTEFVLISPIGDRLLSSTTWGEVVSELHASGYVNMGEVKIIKRTYRWLCDEPQVIDTDY
jgi:hypothetical protein